MRLGTLVHGLIHSFGHGVWGQISVHNGRVPGKMRQKCTACTRSNFRLFFTLPEPAMKKPIQLTAALLLFVLLLPAAFAQRMYDGSGSPIGRVDGERYYNASGQPIGRVDGERVYDGSGRPLGRIDGDRVYNASGSPIGRIDGDRLYSASGSPMGRMDGERLYDGSGRPIGRADGLRRMQMVVFFYFFM
jgi:YD repeat-containing protein